MNKFSKTLIKTFIGIPAKLHNRIMLAFNKVCYDEFPKINGSIYIRNNGEIIIGKRVSINSSHRFNPIGGDTKTSIFVKFGAKLTIGDGVGISNSSIFCANNIIIEDDVFIGGSCRIWDTDFHSLNLEDRISGVDLDIKTRPIIIKYGAFIGGGSIILKGVTVGKGSVIGAGSVITKNVPDGQIWAGNPAKYIRTLDKK